LPLVPAAACFSSWGGGAASGSDVTVVGFSSLMAASAVVFAAPVAVYDG
jgi:hypothetical protein